MIYVVSLVVYSVVFFGWLVMALGDELGQTFDSLLWGEGCFSPRFDGLVKEHMDKV